MVTDKHVLACIDGSAVTGSVCDYAAWYAAKLNISVALLNVSDVAASVRRDLSGAIGINSRQYLLDELSQLDEQRAQVVNSYSNALMEDAKSHIQNRFDVRVCSYQRRGKLLPAIEYFKDQNCAIVMGRRGEDHKNSRINIGSQIETVARASSVPVLICSENFKVPQSYMVAFDGSQTAINAIKTLSESELLKGLQGHIVMISHDSEESNISLNAALTQMTAAGLLVQAHCIQKLDAVDGLLTFQMENDIDLIVVGAYGRSKLRHLFLGSTTTEIIASTVSPVLLVR